MLIEEHEIRFDKEFYDCLAPIDVLAWQIIPMLDKEIGMNIFLPRILSKYI